MIKKKKTHLCGRQLKDVCIIHIAYCILKIKKQIPQNPTMPDIHLAV